MRANNPALPGKQQKQVSQPRQPKTPARPSKQGTPKFSEQDSTFDFSEITQAEPYLIELLEQANIT